MMIFPKYLLHALHTPNNVVDHLHVYYQHTLVCTQMSVKIKISINAMLSCNNFKAFSEIAFWVQQYCVMTSLSRISEHVNKICIIRISGLMSTKYYCGFIENMPEHSLKL